MYGSVDKYYFQVLSFFKKIMGQIFKEQGELFIPIYGSKISFTLKFNLGDYKHASSSSFAVGAYVRGDRLDPTHKSIEIMIDWSYFRLFLTPAVISLEKMKDILIHEFGHVFDKKFLLTQDLGELCGRFSRINSFYL